MEKYDVFFFRLTIAFPLLSRFFFHQPWIWSSEFPILQQNLCFVAAVCSHYVLFSLEKTVLIFFEPRLVLIRPYKDQSSVAWEQVQPLLELLQKGWKEFSHACKAAGEAFFCIPKKKGGAPESGKDTVHRVRPHLTGVSLTPVQHDKVLDSASPNR